LHFQFARSSGPGGQNVNKVNTKTELWIRVDALVALDPGARQRLRTLAGSRLTAADEIHLTAQAHRSQQDNRRQVLTALRELVIAARHVPRRRRKNPPLRRRPPPAPRKQTPPQPDQIWPPRRR
jgi:ribosome-associated protein